MILVPSGVRVHIALGVTDMRKGLDGLAMLVQEVLEQDPFSGHLFAFRGRKANVPDRSAETLPSLPGPAPVIVERSAPGIEVELIGGRRVRFERDVDPETLRRLVTLLEGEAR